MKPRCPFDDKPIEEDDKFFNQNDVIKTISRSIERGKSCAVVGGKGMGKTSILKRLQRNYSRKPVSASITENCYIPIYFKPTKVSSLTDTYEQLIDEIFSQVEEWLKICIIHRTQQRTIKLPKYEIGRLSQQLPKREARVSGFESYLLELRSKIAHEIDNPKFILLLDEIYLLNEDVQNEFIRDLFELLDSKNSQYYALQFHLSVVITCFFSPLEQFNSRQSGVMGEQTSWPNFDLAHLSAFKLDDTRAIIRTSFKKFGLRLKSAVINEIHTITGGHPLLIQKVMCDLWDDATDAEKRIRIDVQHIQNYLSRWRDTHLLTYVAIERLLFKDQIVTYVVMVLLTANELDKISIIKQLNNQNIILQSGDLRDSLFKLTSFGIVQEAKIGTYQLNGEIWRLWIDLTPSLLQRMPTSIYKKKLIDFITDHFNIAELKELCSTLNVEYEDIQGNDKPTKIRELVQYMERRDRSSDLESAAKKLRSGAPG